MSVMQIRRTFFFMVGMLWLLSGCTPDSPPELLRKIKQSNRVYDDIVNGKAKIKTSRIDESTNFFYNNTGLLDSVSVLDDTTATATLLKTIKFVYLQDKIIAHTYDSTGYRELHLLFDADKQITGIVDPIFQSGLYMTYVNNKMTRMIDSSAKTKGYEFTNFIYDNNNNLLQYDISYGSYYGLVKFRYSNRPISDEMDVRFFSRAIKFIYIGGINLLSKCGLNYGLSNHHEVVQSETILLPVNQVVDQYTFSYRYNTTFNDIKERTIEWDTDTLHYEFEY